MEVKEMIESKNILIFREIKEYVTYMKQEQQAVIRKIKEFIILKSLLKQNFNSRPDSMEK